MRSIAGFLARLAFLRCGLLRCTARTTGLWPVRRSELEGVDHLADSVAVRDPSLVDVFNEIPNVGKRRGMSKVCREVSILAREVHRVRRASPGTDSGRVRFVRSGRRGEVGLFGFRLHCEQYRAEFPGWHAAGDMVLRQRMADACEEVYVRAIERMPRVDRPGLPRDSPSMETSSACPGCGLTLPVSDWPIDRRTNASPACWQLYLSVVGHELDHLPQLGGLHQLTLDAYGAQHAGDQVPPIGTAFSLIGLHLALDEGWSGNAVRAAHQHLAANSSTWPRFVRPATRGALTIAHVAGSPTPKDHAQRVRALAASVWEAWSMEHDRVRQWANQALSAADRARLQSDR